MIPACICFISPYPVLHCNLIFDSPLGKIRYYTFPRSPPELDNSQRDFTGSRIYQTRVIRLGETNSGCKFLPRAARDFATAREHCAIDSNVPRPSLSTIQSSILGPTNTASYDSAEKSCPASRGMSTTPFPLRILHARYFSPLNQRSTPPSHENRYAPAPTQTTCKSKVGNPNFNPHQDRTPVARFQISSCDPGKVGG